MKMADCVVVVVVLGALIDLNSSVPERAEARKI